MPPSTANLCLHPDFITAVSTYYNIAIGLAIILAVIMVIVGGYQMVLSTGNPTIIEKGKKRIQNALFGLGLAILSFVFLFTEMFGRAVAGIGVGLAVSVPLAVGISALEIIVVLVQAYVFTLLTAVFIGMAIHVHH